MRNRVVPPVEPMLARLARELPLEGFLYEPKWDGFRCLASGTATTSTSEVATRGRSRRRRLEMLLAGASGRLRLTPITADPKVAERWLERFQGSGIDGAVAKQGDLRYVPGRQEMVKVNHEQTADCVVGGFRVFADRPLPSSLLLGLYDGGGRLHHVGVASSFPERAREGLLEHLSPLAARPRSAVVPPRPALAAASRIDTLLPP